MFVLDVERHAWDRRPDESAKAYSSFREYRDMGPLRSLGKMATTSRRNAEHWSARHAWVARASAWDDEQHMIEDRERLEALRSMHSNHRAAARAVQAYALTALQRLSIDEASSADVARLLDLGTRLERLTLSTSVEQLQTSNGMPVDDPWSRIARELSDT